MTSSDWLVPAVAVDEADSLLRVTAFDGANAVIARDISDATFTILAGLRPFQLVAPNGLESLTAVDAFEVMWNARAGAASYRLHYSIDNGSSWLFVTDVGSVTSYSWTVPAVAADEPDALFRVSAFSSPSPGPGAVLTRDKSNSPFTIEPSAP